MKEAYEKPKILETMPIEEVLMDEEISQGWANWNNSSWNQNWKNSGSFPQTPVKLVEGDEK